MSEDAPHLAAAKAGDKQAFSRLVEKYKRRVYATALHITGNHSDADDVAQDAFVKAYRHLGSFDGRADFFTWLYRITINTGLNHLRSRKRSERLAAGEEQMERLAAAPDLRQRTPEEWAQLQDRLRFVLEQVCQLSPVLRVTLVLATVEQLPYRQIAEILDVPEGTVAWRVNEARRQLREGTRELDDVDEEAV